MPGHLTGSCTTFDEGLELCLSKDPTLLIVTQLLEEGSGLDLVNAVKKENPHLRTLLFCSIKICRYFKKLSRPIVMGLFWSRKWGLAM